MRRCAVPIILLFLLSFSATASAQELDVRELNTSGMQAFAEGRYEEAAELFGRAYALDPQGELLKNQSVAWYKAGRCTEAVEASHQFLLRGNPTSAERSEAQALIGACKVRLAREALDAGSFELAEKLLDDVDAMQPDPVLADRAALVRVDLAKRRAHEAPSSKKTEPALVALDGTDDKREVRPVEKPSGEVERKTDAPDTSSGAAPLIGIGSVMLAGAVAYHLVMALVVEPNFRETAEEGLDRSRYNSLDRSLRTANILVPTLYGVGGAVTATGIFVLMSRSGPENEEEVVMLGLSGRF